MTAPRKSRGSWQVSHAQDDLLDEFPALYTFDVGKKGGLQERELLEPDRMGNDQVQFFETDLSRPGVRGQRLSYDVAPLTL
ncbi:MAG: hypothetical protein NNA18_05000 [Nitrospira sp.]|nr:hypothetical protein [Nitrospira sp.]